MDAKSHDLKMVKTMYESALRHDVTNTWPCCYVGENRLDRRLPRHNRWWYEGLEQLTCAGDVTPHDLEPRFPGWVGTAAGPAERSTNTET